MGTAADSTLELGQVTGWGWRPASTRAIRSVFLTNLVTAAPAKPPSRSGEEVRAQPQHPFVAATTGCTFRTSRRRAHPRVYQRVTQNLETDALFRFASSVM